MKFKRITTLLLIGTFVITLTGCGGAKQMEETIESGMATFDDITSTVTGRIKNNLIDAGAAVEEDFIDNMLPSYNVMRLGDENFNLPIEYDKNKLEDALVITHNMNVKSDMIVILQAKTDADIPELENYVKKLRDDQYKAWESYLPDQFEKVQKNVTKTIGRYVIYITYDEPQGIVDELEKILK